MVNRLVTEIYSRFLFKIDALPQNLVFPIDITITFFNNLISDVRELFISSWVQVPPRPPNKTNHQGNYRLFLVINAAVEAEKETRTINTAVQSAILI